MEVAAALPGILAAKHRSVYFEFLVPGENSTIRVQIHCAHADSWKESMPLSPVSFRCAPTVAVGEVQRARCDGLRVVWQRQRALGSDSRVAWHRQRALPARLSAARLQPAARQPVASLRICLLQVTASATRKSEL